MKLKTHLFFVFNILVVLPIIITIFFMTFISNIHIAKIEQYYNTNSKGFEIVLRPAHYFTRLTDESYDKLVQLAEIAPEKLEDVNYLKEINNELMEKSSFLMVESNSELVFGDENELDQKDLTWEHFNVFDHNYETSAYMNKNQLSYVRTISFQNSEGEAEKIYIVTRLNQNLFNFRKLLILEMSCMVIILLISVAFIAFCLYKYIWKSIEQIMKAMQNAKEGNLDFEIKVKSIKEIENMATDFNEIRDMLKIQAEEKVKYDSESKELISNISHDLKTPITAVKGYVEGIIDGVADTPEKIDRYIKTIYNKANDMDRLINELTFYSKIDTNRIPYTFTRLNVENYFSDCIEEVGLDLEEKNIELTYFNYTPKTTQIIADAEQLKRVIYNIVGNSIKYLDKPKGCINIRIKDEEEFILVEIEDNGKGIGESDLPFIFDRFYRTDASRNSAKGGSGIGLSIVKKIIEDHGGEIWATSKEMTGTIMYFKLRKYQEVQIYE